MMSDLEREGTLVLSTNSGRYALDAALGMDLTAGMTAKVWLGGHWIPGSIEHAGALYATPARVAALYRTSGQEKLGQAGYYFVGYDGSVCGLCVGMKVLVYV